MQVSSGTAVLSTTALLQAAQLSNLSSSLFGTLSTQTTATAPSTATPAPASNLLSPSLTQALINSTQLTANTSASSGSVTATSSAGSDAPTTDLPCVFAPPAGWTSTTTVMTPAEMAPNLTQSDLSVLQAAFGFTPNEEPTSGQSINAEAWNAFQKMSAVISYNRGNGSLQGNLTATEFSNLAAEVSSGYDLPLTSTQIDNGLNAINNQI